MATRVTTPRPASTAPQGASAPLPQFRVLGIVRHADGRGAAGLTVRAFDRDMRNEQLLGEAVADAAGAYQIVYTADKFANSEKDAADLLMRVYRRDAVVYDPPIVATLFNAPNPARIDIDLAGAADGAPVPSDYETVLAAVTPLLDGVALPDLQESDKARDLSFLAAETGIAIDRLVRFAVAQKLASAHKIVPEFFHALLAEDTLLRLDLAGAAGFRLGIDLDTDLTALYYDVVLLPPETVAAAVAQAIADAWVPASLQDRLKGIQRQ